MTRLVLTRHGETVWHAANRYAGSTNVALTPRGHQQARLLAGWAANADLCACWSSTLTRARETVGPAALAAGVPAHHDPRLVELDFGAGEGLTAAEMTEQLGSAWSDFRGDPVAYHLPGGEDPGHAIARAVDALHDICAAYPDGRVLVVWHSTILRLVLCHLLGMPLANYRRVFPFVRNGGLTEIRIANDEVTALLEFNSPIEAAPLVDAPRLTNDQPGVTS